MEFRTKIKNWLEPLGFEFIFATNHPTKDQDEVHYIKDKVRICCYKNTVDYYNFHSDIQNARMSVSVISQKYILGGQIFNKDMEVNHKLFTDHVKRIKEL